MTNTRINLSATGDDGELDRCVQTLCGALEVLVGDLVDEREALRQRAAPDALERIALRKSLGVEQITKCYALLRDSMRNTSGDERIEDAVLHLREQAPHLGTQVDRLVELIRQCQIANQENGALIGAGLRHTRGALATLAALTTADRNELYDADGHTSASGTAAHHLTLRA